MPTLKPLALLAASMLARAFAPLPLSAQFDQPPATLAHQFSRIVGVVELSDGRVVVADAKERLLYVGDFSTGQTRQLGRNGRGPDEYQGVFGLVRARGDTVLSYDPSNNRLLKIGPTGLIAGVLSFSAGARLGGLAAPKGVDDHGRLYWDRVVMTTGPDGMPRRGWRFEVVRWSPETDSVVVVARPMDHAEARNGQRFHPFGSRDEWVVDQGGRVLVVASDPYRLLIVSSAVRAFEGPLLPFLRAAVTEADREAYRRDVASRPQGSMTFTSPVTGERVSAELIARARATYPDELFPSVRPPFVAGAVHLAPSGEIWVARWLTPDQRVREVDVLSPTGALRRKVQIPPRARVVRLDRGGIYLAREDDDGFETLERYQWLPSSR